MNLAQLLNWIERAKLDTGERNFLLDAFHGNRLKSLKLCSIIPARAKPLGEIPPDQFEPSFVYLEYELYGD